MMKSLRWTSHALDNLADREIDKEVADRTLAHPEFVVSSQSTRKILMRRYFDQILQQDMLLRIVVEDTESEIVVVTLYKTSQFGRYLKELGL